MQGKEMPKKLYMPIVLIIIYFVINYRNVDALCISILVAIAVGFYFRVSASRYIIVFFMHYAALLGLIMLRFFGTTFTVSVGGYHPNPILSICTFVTILLLFAYSISGREVEEYFSRKVNFRKYASYINIHIIIVYLAVGLASITYFQVAEKAFEGNLKAKVEENPVK